MIDLKLPERLNAGDKAQRLKTMKETVKIEALPKTVRH